MSNPSEPDVPDTEEGDKGDQDTFLMRWARRKAGKRDRASSENEVEAGALDENAVSSDGESIDSAHDQQDLDAAHNGADSRVQPEPTEAEAPKEAEKGDEDMPALDTIDDGGSVSDFFSSKVSPALRKAALRRLFGQSTLPVGDDLDDYAGDYTKFTKLGDLVTSEMRYRMEVARQRLLQRKAEAEAEAANDDTGADDERLALAESPSESAQGPPTPAGKAGREADAETFRREAARGDDAPARKKSAEKTSTEEISTKESASNDPDPG